MCKIICNSINSTTNCITCIGRYPLLPKEEGAQMVCVFNPLAKFITIQRYYCKHCGDEISISEYVQGYKDICVPCKEIEDYMKRKH